MTTLRQFNGFSPILGTNVFIDTTAIVIGNVTIGDDSSIWPLTVIRGDVNGIIIGEGTNIQDGSVLHVSRPSSRNLDGYPLSVGNHVTVGHSVILHGCRIGNRVLIGMGSTLLDGAVVRDEVIIAAGSLVPEGKTLESGHLYMGIPAKKVRQLEEWELDMFTDTAKHYMALKDNYLALEEY